MDQVILQPKPTAKKGESPGFLLPDWQDLHRDVKICVGHYSQANKRFLHGSNEQGPAVSVMAASYAVLKRMSAWKKETLDEIIDFGTNLYKDSLHIGDNKCKKVGLLGVKRNFFIKNLQVTFKFGTDIINLSLSRDEEIQKKLESVFEEFFKQDYPGIFFCHDKYFTVWKLSHYLFIFDASDHDSHGKKWTGLQGSGYPISMRFTKIKGVVDTIMRNITIRHKNRFLLYPCHVENVVVIKTKAPKSFEDAVKKPSPVPVQPEPSKPKKNVEDVVKKPPSGPVPPEPSKPQKQRNVLTKVSKLPEPKKEPVQVGEKVEPKLSKQVFPVKPSLKSVSNFTQLYQGKAGILRGSTHEKDPKFTKFQGAQFYSNAIAALTMLRIHRSKKWIGKIIDDILKLGDTIHSMILRLPKGQLPKQITINEKAYTPVVTEFPVVGTLESDDDKILDLKSALVQFFLQNDCGILSCRYGKPQAVALWKQDDHYYLFDPEPRDSFGQIPQTKEPGFACVTWFAKIDDLVSNYLANVPKGLTKKNFTLFKVTIRDYIHLPGNWFNFKELTPTIWILRGTFNQSDRRFPIESRNAQCTANATMALAYKELTPIDRWNSDTIDQVLINGNEFYLSCVNFLKEHNRYRDKYLLVDEVNRVFNLADKQVNLEILDCHVNGILNVKDDDPNCLNLKKGLYEFFAENNGGVVTANLLSTAVWKSEGVYYYFDSHSRDKNGRVTSYGTACVLRYVTIEDLANGIMRNLISNRENYYNIGKVDVHLINLAPNGVTLPPLNNYTPITDLMAILRSNFSEDSPKFCLTVGKQTVPMCLAAVVVTNLIPSIIWDVSDLDQVLAIGNQLYVESMDANYEDGVAEDQNVDEISSNNVKKELKIGANLFQMEFEDYAQGTIGDNLEDALKNKVITEDIDAFRSILESQYMTVSLWRDNNLFYVFDPRPRDELGSVYGKDDWSVKKIPTDDEEKEEEEEKEKGAGDNNDPPEIQNLPGGQVVDDGGGDIIEEKQSVPTKKSSAHWRQKEKEGKACVLRFGLIEDMIKHLVENSPPNQREEIEFTLKTIKINNNPVLKEVFKPECGDKVDDIAGDWNNFVEIEYGKWIIRGSKNLTDASYPECNRGKQQIPTCLVALACSKRYAMRFYRNTIVDVILGYGDRYYTVVRKKRQTELKASKQLGLTDQEIGMILNGTIFTIKDYPRNLRIGHNMDTWTPEETQIEGDITSNLPETIADLPTGLTALFGKYAYGVLVCKNYYVAVWKKDGIFYMFDPHQCGPSGLQSPSGVACITRFKNVGDLALVFLNNLPVEGSHFFEIFPISVVSAPEEQPPEQKPEKQQPVKQPEKQPVKQPEKQPVKQPEKQPVKQPEKQPVKQPDKQPVKQQPVKQPVKQEPVKPQPEKRLPKVSSKLGGYAQVAGGKDVLRGHTKGESSEFRCGVHKNQYPIAFVTLALSLITEPNTWTNPIIDQIFFLGSDLNYESRKKLGSKFESVDRLGLKQIKTDFQIGSFNFSCRIRSTEQKGTVLSKSSKIINLRQGIERFFQENSHGILTVDRLVLPIWEDSTQKQTYIYIFDPNSRGVTGLPTQDGFACVTRFANTKLVSDHVSACLVGVDRNQTEFGIIALEIMVGSKILTKKKKKVTPTKATCLEKKILGGRY